MSETKLSSTQRARIERNRQRALLLRSSRLSSRPYPDREAKSSHGEGSGGISRVVDTGGGFLLDPEDEEEACGLPQNIVEDPAPILGEDQKICTECGKEFMDSFLYSTFDAPICDNCRDHKEKHALITKTDAKQQFLLKDADFDRRGPPLKYKLKKNPHYARGDMKLYLKSQVIARAYEVWGSEEGLLQAKEEKSEKREEQKQRKFDKKVKELRKAVRTSTWRKDLSKHTHEFLSEGKEGGETYDKQLDTWTKTCKTCGYKLTYEKM
ncbi:DNA repair protein complementing XP-A cells homolog [Nematostella vectensis]|uniref:DNA repair protein complementing XP-A cells homolog n=1 Tax=Nematostella vectensis TaxID=45351 RepID=UPI0020775F64|nr:DNA repair protein complementing XP-A cells homolog [Nematostella vectensis]